MTSAQQRLAAILASVPKKPPPEEEPLLPAQADPVRMLRVAGYKPLEDYPGSPVAPWGVQCVICLRPNFVTLYAATRGQAACTHDYTDPTPRHRYAGRHRRKDTTPDDRP